VALLNIAQNDKSQLSFINTKLTASSYGMVFDGVSGVYTFKNAILDMQGSKKGLTIKAVIDGSFSFDNSTITGKPKTSLITLASNSVPVLFNDMSLDQKGTGETLSIAAGDTTKFSVTGSLSITAKGGGGILFNNVGGTYDFSGANINMVGVTNGLNILNTSNGIFKFDTTTIKGNYSKAVIAMNKSPMAINFNSGSVTQSGNGAILFVNKDTNSEITFTNTVMTATSGTGLSFDSVSGRYNFSGVTVNMNGSESAVTINNSTSLASISFDNTKISGRTDNALINLSANAVAINISGGTITQSGTGGAIKVGPSSIQQLIFAGGKTTTINAPNGYGVLFNGAGGIYDFTGASLRGSTKGSFIDFTASNTMTINKGSFTQNGSGPLLSASNDSGAAIIFTGTALMATSGQGLYFDDTHGSYDFSDSGNNISLTNTTSGLSITDSSGVFNFANFKIDKVKGNYVYTNNNTAKINFLGGLKTQN
ncbi:MAG: hypothetical protein JKY19_06835, partial [Alcanivoracaceae bacterium]|nr:hypothetical protein [Alcanivoracaceae bacterium]